MHRRCSFLDSLPAFNFNSGYGEYVETEQGRVATNTRQLGSTLMATMLKEVADFCHPAIRENWSHKPHQQVGWVEHSLPDKTCSQSGLLSRASHTSASYIARVNCVPSPPVQLIYDFKEGGASLGLISLHPDQLPPKDKLRFQRIGVNIPSMTSVDTGVNMVENFEILYFCLFQ